MRKAARPTAEHCHNCGTKLTGPYCAQCGQSAHDGHAPSLGHLLHDFTHEFLHVDGKIFRTLKSLFFQPGQLTKEYWHGRVVPWVRPLRLFIIFAAIHALLATGIGPANFKVWIEKTAKGDYNTFATGRETGRGNPADRARVPAAQQTEFHDAFQRSYLSVKYAAPFLLAAMSWLLYRGREAYYVRHLVFAFHFYCVLYTISLAGDALGRMQVGFAWIGLLTVVYMLAALRQLFRESWPVVIVKTAVLFGVMLLVELALGSFATQQALRKVHLA